MRRNDSIPILLLTGFLGAGKTTLLNHLLSNTQNLRIGVIVNDFGQVNIDSMLVAAQTDTTLELSNGCICCSAEDGQLDNALGQLAYRGSLLDYIVVEASGLAETRELATVLRMIRNNYCHFDALATVIDASNFDKNRKEHGQAFADLAIADIIVINKVDLITSKALPTIKKQVKVIAPRARIIEAEQARVDYQLLLGPEPKQDVSSQLKLQEHDHEHDHIHDRFQSLSLTTDDPLDPVAFELWANNLPLEIFRAKGVVYFGAKGAYQKFVFQAVGQRYTLKLDDWQANEKQTTSLVVIGKDIDNKLLDKQLKALIDPQPDNINQETLMDIFKYK